MDTNIALNTIEEKRDFLRTMSRAVAPLVQSQEYGTVNEAVIDVYYKNKTDAEFKTFHQWKAEGYSIKKGAKAFIVWGKPKRAQDAEEARAKGKEEPATDDDKSNFFPIAFLFSNAQVEIRKGNQNV